MFTLKARPLAATVIALGMATGLHAQTTDPIIAAGSDEARANLDLFDKLDFEGWNGPDFETFAGLHSEDVKVEGFGQATDGRPAHVEWSEGFIENYPDLKIEAHPIQVAADDWTAVIGTLSDGSQMATFAKWKDGQIVEEYLFTLDTGEK